MNLTSSAPGSTHTCCCAPVRQPYSHIMRGKLKSSPWTKTVQLCSHACPLTVCLSVFVDFANMYLYFSQPGLVSFYATYSREPLFSHTSLNYTNSMLMLLEHRSSWPPSGNPTPPPPAIVDPFGTIWSTPCMFTLLGGVCLSSRNGGLGLQLWLLAIILLLLGFK